MSNDSFIEFKVTIGQLAKRAGVNPQTIRYYEREGILPQARRRVGSDYRDYAEDTLQTLMFIKEAQKAGFKLAQIQELFNSGLQPEHCCTDVQVVIEERLEEVRLLLRQLRCFERSLKTLLCRCRENRAVARCPALSLLHYRKPEGQ